MLNAFMNIATRYIELALLVILLFMYSFATYQRNLVWQDNMSLWTDIVKKSPSKARGYNELGVAYHKVGEIDNAIMQYKESLSLNPFSANTHNNIAVSYFDKGLVDKAISHFKHAIEINPSHADAHYNLGVAYGDKGFIDMANEEIRMGIKLRRR
jgi:tetratricopeptide (TPR) repeat protein